MLNFVEIFKISITYLTQNQEKVYTLKMSFYLDISTTILLFNVEGLSISAIFKIEFYAYLTSTGKVCLQVTTFFCNQSQKILISFHYKL